jgi:glycosyltransferase involved in cell wall biosynthesis
VKILIITKQVPFPPNSGYPIVVYNTIKGLLNIGVDITLFSLNPLKDRVDVEDIYDPVFDKINRHFVDIDTGSDLLSAFFNFFTNESYTVSRFFSEDCVRMLENVLRENTFDIIQFESLFVVPYLDTVKANSNAKLIYRAHNIEFSLWDRLAVSERFMFRRKYLIFLASRLRDYETDQINRFHHIFAISEPDRQSIIRFGCEIPVTVFPVAVDLKKYKVDKGKTSFPTLFHLGAMDWAPNEEGLEWFLDEIWPDIDKLNRDLRFYIAGKNMQKRFFDYDSENLIVEGEVFDAVEFINSKAIMIVPLLSGTGMRVKIIEGMAMQKCIIATSIAAEGINYKQGYDILIANSADEFYRHILQCIINPTKWIEMGENARKTVERDHEINANTKGMLNVYKQLSST